MKIEGIIFDLDGTLVNTEPLHMEAWLSVLAKEGLQFDHEWFEQWIGKSDRFLAESVIQEHQLQVGYPVLQKAKAITYHQLASEQAQFFPKVEAYILQLKNSMKLGIATNSSRKDAEAVFSSLPLPEYVSAIVTADDVPNLKPAPDMYILAAEKVNLPVKRGVAIEDSPAGLQAAKSAGLFTLAVTNSQSADNLRAADMIFTTTAQAIEWVMGQNG